MKLNVRLPEASGCRSLFRLKTHLDRLSVRKARFIVLKLKCQASRSVGMSKPLQIKTHFDRLSVTSRRHSDAEGISINILNMSKMRFFNPLRFFQNDNETNVRLPEASACRRCFSIKRHTSTGSV